MFTAPPGIFVATRPKSSPSRHFRPVSARIPFFREEEEEDVEDPFQHLSTHFADVVLAMRSAATPKLAVAGNTAISSGKKGKKKGKKRGGRKGGKAKEKDETAGWPLEDRVAHKLTIAFDNEDIMIQQKLAGTWVETKKRAKKTKGRKGKGRKGGKNKNKGGKNKDSTEDGAVQPGKNLLSTNDENCCDSGNEGNGDDDDEGNSTRTGSTVATTGASTGTTLSTGNSGVRKARDRRVTSHRSRLSRQTAGNAAEAELQMQLSADEVTCWKGWTSIKINQAESNLAIIRPPKESANDGEATGVGKDSIAGVTSEYDWVKFLSTPATGSRISKMFRESSGSTIRLVGYSLSEDNTKIMAMAIQRHPKLVILELENNALSTQATKLILRAIPDTVERLSLAGNENLSASFLSNYVSRSAVHLVQLDLSACGLKDAGLLTVAQALFSQSAIRKLNLSRNGITVDSGKLLAGLVELDRIRDLRLDWNELGQRGIVHISQAMKTSQHLHSLDLSWNGIGTNALDLSRGRSDGVRELAGMLKDNTTLWHLNLSANTFTTRDVHELSEALRHNQTVLVHPLLNSQIHTIFNDLILTLGCFVR